MFSLTHTQIFPLYSSKLETCCYNHRIHCKPDKKKASWWLLRWTRVLIVISIVCDLVALSLKGASAFEKCKEWLISIAIRRNSLSQQNNFTLIISWHVCVRKVKRKLVEKRVECISLEADRRTLQESPAVPQIMSSGWKKWVDLIVHVCQRLCSLCLVLFINVECFK